MHFWAYWWVSFLFLNCVVFRCVALRCVVLLCVIICAGETDPPPCAFKSSLALRSPIWAVRQLDAKVLAVASSGGLVHLLTADTGIQVSFCQWHVYFLQTDSADN